MKLNYTFKHLDHSDSLVDYVTERMEEAGQFLLKEGHGNVYFSKTKNEFCVEVSFNTREKFFKASGHSDNIYAAVEEVVEKLEKQFLKMSKQMKNHKKPELSREGRLDLALRFRKAA